MKTNKVDRLLFRKTAEAQDRFTTLDLLDDFAVLEAENAKLREALKAIENLEPFNPHVGLDPATRIARTALAESGEGGG